MEGAAHGVPVSPNSGDRTLLKLYRSENKVLFRVWSCVCRPLGVIAVPCLYFCLVTFDREVEDEILGA